MHLCGWVEENILSNMLQEQLFSSRLAEELHPVTFKMNLIVNLYEGISLEYSTAVDLLNFSSEVKIVLRQAAGAVRA
jgi:hypothetical protein